MAQSIACPNCRAKLFAPPDVYGQPVRCTNCASTFTASIAHSPYLDDMPALPKDRRRLIMGLAVLSCLVVGTMTLFCIDWLTDDTRNVGQVDPRVAEKALTDHREAVQPKLPPGLPEDDPDKLEAMLIPKKAAAPAAKKPTSLHDVNLLSVRWSATPGLRVLQVSYEFQNNASPTAGKYSWVFKFDRDEERKVPVGPTTSLKGELSFTLEATLSDRPGRNPKVTVWVEKEFAGVKPLTASNSVSTE